VIVAESEAQLVRVGVVTFKDGAVNKMHSHTFDQVLVITEGEGSSRRRASPSGT